VRGLLTLLLPRDQCPAPFAAWTRLALQLDPDPASFEREVRVPEVASAVMEIDELLGRLFGTYFGDAVDGSVKVDYLEAMHRFATDILPPALERDARVAPDDPRKRTAGRHTLDGDLMWFAWAMQIEAAIAVVGADCEHPRRVLTLAAVASGCGANFAWRGHRRTRREYQPGLETEVLLRERGLRWSTDLAAAAGEVQALYRIRETGEE